MPVEIRAIRDDDVPAWVELRNAIDPRMATLPAWVDQRRRIEPTLLLVIAHDGPDVVGVGAADEPSERRGLDVGWMWFGVEESRRREGIGAALRQELSQHLRGLGKTSTHTSAWSDDLATVSFLCGRGFVEDGRFDFVRLDLEAYEPQPVEPPNTVSVVPLAGQTGFEQEMYTVHCEALADLPSSDELTPEYDAFYAWEIAHPARSHDFSFLALHDGHVIGYATLGAVPGSNDATNVMTAVKREWRRRGVAAALKAEQLAAAKRAGFSGIVTLNEVKNEPMRKLNAKLGYVPQPAQLLMRGPLDREPSGVE